MDTTNFIARWVRMRIHRRTVAFRRHLPPNQSPLSPVGQSDKDTLLPTICAHILPGTRVERHGEGLRLPMRRELHLSLNQPKPKLRTQARTPSAVKIHSRGSNELCLVQDYQHFGDDPFAKTSSISPTYIKPRKYCSSIVRLYVLFVT